VPQGPHRELALEPPIRLDRQWQKAKRGSVDKVHQILHPIAVIAALQPSKFIECLGWDLDGAFAAHGFLARPPQKPLQQKFS
jgi:hypothetical protein